MPPLYIVSDYNSYSYYELTMLYPKLLVRKSLGECQLFLFSKKYLLGDYKDFVNCYDNQNQISLPFRFLNIRNQFDKNSNEFFQLKFLFKHAKPVLNKEKRYKELNTLNKFDFEKKFINKKVFNILKSVYKDYFGSIEYFIKHDSRQKLITIADNF